jgi:hypothetical protein
MSCASLIQVCLFDLPVLAICEKKSDPYRRLVASPPFLPISA